MRAKTKCPRLPQLHQDGLAQIFQVIQWRVQLHQHHTNRAAIIVGEFVPGLAVVGIARPLNQHLSCLPLLIRQVYRMLLVHAFSQYLIVYLNLLQIQVAIAEFGG